MTTMTRAVIASRAGGPEVLALTERSLAPPVGRELLVRVHAAGINRPDVMQRQGNYPPPPGATDVLGLELTGVVEATGPGSGAVHRSARRHANRSQGNLWPGRRRYPRMRLR